MEEVDLTEKVVNVPFDAPISIVFDAETDTLYIENERQENPGVPRIKMRAVFKPAAIRQLLSSLKLIEAALKLTEERVVETNFLDKTNIL